MPTMEDYEKSDGYAKDTQSADNIAASRGVSNPISTSGPSTTTNTPSSSSGSSSSSSGGNAPVSQTAPTSTSGGSGGSSFVPSQSLPGYSYTKPTWLDSMSNQDQLNYYKSDPNQAQLELNRSKQVYSDAIAKGDILGAQRASTYADQIRQASGIGNNDPFYGSAGGNLQSQGQVNLNVNGQSKPAENVYNGTSYDDAAHLAQTLGLSYSRDQNGKPVIGGKTIDSSYIDKNGNVQVPTRLVGNLLGMKVEWDPNKSTVSITGGNQDNTPQQGPTNGTGSGGGWLDTVAGGIPGTPQLQQYQQPDMSYYQNQMLPYGQFNNDMSSYYNQAKNQLDPQAQASYNQLMGKQNLDINHMNDSMNRRGIFTSGIAQAAENDLRAKTTNSIASIFTKEQSDIAKTAQSLYNSAYKQFLSGNQFALKNNTDMLTQMMADKKQAFTQYIQTQHLTMDQSNYALKAWDSMSNYIYKNAQMQMQDQHFNQTMNFNQFKFDNLSADQTAQLHKSYDQMTQDWQKSLLPYQNQTADQIANMDYKQQALQLQAKFKELGYNLDVSKLEELVRHNQAGEQNQADSNNLKLYDMMGFDKNGTPTLKRDQLQQVINHDAQTVQISRDNATTNANKSIVDGIGRQLSSINSQIAAMYGQPNVDQNMLKSLSDKRDTYLNQLSQYTNQGFIQKGSSGGFIGPPDPANFHPGSP
jgi:hypothetical protein